MYTATKKQAPAAGQDDGFDKLLKLLIVGESGVGKSSILTRFTEDTFSSDFMTTIGVDFKFKSLLIEGKTIRLQIWDTAGQERFRAITTCYYRGAQGILLVFDVTQPETFQKLPLWLEEIKKNCKKDVKVVVAANKIDEKVKNVDMNSVKEFCEKNALKYVETSAKENTNIEKVFTELARSVLGNTLATSDFKNKAGLTNTVKVDVDNQEKPQGNCSC
jgi:small GTP-binding protein